MITHRDEKGRIVRRPLADKFWEKVDKNGPVVRPELGPCWAWTARCFGNGYGAFTTYNRELRRKNHLTHRLAWRLVVGPIPRGKCVLHHCDNRSCVRADRNPTKSHLFLGTQADNLADMRAKGREAPREARMHCGEENGSAKLTAAKVRRIRKLFKPRVRGYKVLAAAFNISPHTISAIVRGKIWRQPDAGYGVLGVAFLSGKEKSSGQEASQEKA